MTEQDIQQLIDRVAETRDLFTFDDFIRHWAGKSPNRAAIDSDDLQLTYAELEQATARVASALQAAARRFAQLRAATVRAAALNERALGSLLPDHLQKPTYQGVAGKGGPRAGRGYLAA